jgi:hypothetical protein
MLALRRPDIVWIPHDMLLYYKPGPTRIESALYDMEGPVYSLDA